MADIDQRNLGLISAGVAFWGMLAVFPALAAIIALWGFFADPEVVNQQLETLREIIPPQPYELIHGQVQAIIARTSRTLGWTTALSTGLALWWARAGTAALIRGLNASYRTDNRSGVWPFFIAIIVTLALVAVSLVALLAVVGVPVVLNFLPLFGMGAVIAQVMRWGIASAVMIVGLGVIYRYGPNTRGVRPPWISAGAVISVVIWALASWGFSLYLTNFNRYNEIYGTLGAVVALLMWFYISAYVVLLGAVLNAELGNRHRRRLAREHEAALRRANRRAPPMITPQKL